MYSRPDQTSSLSQNLGGLTAGKILFNGKNNFKAANNYKNDFLSQ
jgi:hypothetical protein